MLIFCTGSTYLFSLEVHILSNGLHDFPVTISGCHKDVHISLPLKYVSLLYNLNDSKSRANNHLWVLSYQLSYMLFILFFFLL